MEYSDILQGLSKFCEKYDSQTFLGSYRETTRDSLLKDGLGTRANSLWKMAEYIVAYKGENETGVPATQDEYITGWKKLTSRYGNQILFLETEAGVWHMYDSKGNELGDDQYIQGYIASQKTNESNESQQLIFFGAPGTGKSHRLKTRAKKFEGRYGRVTFYPTYTYQQFVGTYKPIMVRSVTKTDVAGTDVTETDKEQQIAYKYVPGPFLRLLLKALQNPSEDYLLIIEELNRANAAAVFGDVFQLLDREHGKSTYSVAINEELRLYLEDLGDLGIKSATKNYTELFLPSNFYIWATMNSADQGVFPMDTAFKRRWEFEFLDINENEAKIEDKCFDFKDGTYEWNAIRKAINEKLLGSGINEDKQLGPFFIKSESMENMDSFMKVFKSKVLMYLFEDAVRHDRNILFKGERKDLAYSKICQKLDKEGLRAVLDIVIDPVKQSTSVQGSVSPLNTQ